MTKTELIKALRDAGDDEYADWKLKSWKLSDLQARLDALTAKPAKRVKSRPLSVKDVAEAVRKERTGASSQPPVDGKLPCTRCGETKPVAEFYPTKKAAYAKRGYTIWCKPCIKVQRAEYSARKAQP